MGHKQKIVVQQVQKRFFRLPSLISAPEVGETILN